MEPVSPLGGQRQLAIHRLGLGREDFLYLLTTQLKNQNPLDPLENQDFIAQLATFSTLEQMIHLNESFTSFININTKSAIISTLGREVSVLVDKKNISGFIIEINYKNNIPYIKVLHDGGIIETEFTNIVSIK